VPSEGMLSGTATFTEDCDDMVARVVVPTVVPDALFRCTSTTTLLAEKRAVFWTVAVSCATPMKGEVMVIEEEEMTSSAKGETARVAVEEVAKEVASMEDCPARRLRVPVIWLSVSSIWTKLDEPQGTDTVYAPSK